MHFFVEIALLFGDKEEYGLAWYRVKINGIKKHMHFCVAWHLKTKPRQTFNDDGTHLSPTTPQAINVFICTKNFLQQARSKRVNCSIKLQFTILTLFQIQILIERVTLSP